MIFFTQKTGPFQTNGESQRFFSLLPPLLLLLFLFFSQRVKYGMGL